MLRKKILTASLCVLVPFSLVAGTAQARVDLAGRARAALEARVAAGTTVGAVAGIVHPDGQLEVVAAGRSGNASRPQLDAQTLFEIGSITKTFTATLLAQRVERGDLRLETTVREAAPGLRDWKRPGVGDVTLGQLATHTAGLPRLPIDPWFLLGRVASRDGPYGHYASDDLLEHAARSDSPGHGPHTFAYSNYGMGLLGEILARREGTSFDALVRRDILAPLGMTRSGTETAPGDAALLARGHDSSLFRVGYWKLPGLGGAGALRSNVEEMAKYVLAHRDGLLAGVRLTHEQRAKAGGSSGVGLAWIIRPSPTGRILWHNGGTGGFRSFAGFHEGTRIGVVVLSNSSVGVDEIGMHLLDPSRPLESPASPPAWLLAVVAAVALSLPWMAWRTRHAARPDALWTGFAIMTTALLLHVAAPWGPAGPWAWRSMVALTLGSLAMVAWRARALPARTPDRPSSARRAIERAATVALFGFCLLLL